MYNVNMRMNNMLSCVGTYVEICVLCISVAVSVIIFSLYRGFNNFVRGFIKLYKNLYILETIF